MTTSTFDRFDPTTWPRYDEAEHKERILQEADAMGEAGECRYEDGFDWDRFTLRLEERVAVAFPTTWDDPLYAAIKRVARKAWKEANG
jgi:hypothetical protein